MVGRREGTSKRNGRKTDSALGLSGYGFWNKRGAETAIKVRSVQRDDAKNKDICQGQHISEANV